jgi:uncharacterized protein (DUF2147 family)
MNAPRGCRLYAVMAVCLFFTSISAQPVNDSIIGKWCLEDKTCIFDFYRTGNEYRARLVPLAKPDIVDTHNPVDSLRNRRLSGATLVYSLVYDAKKNRWDGGRVYNPENGKTYMCHCTLAAGGTKLLFRGYLGISILGETRTWTRVTRTNIMQ